MLANVLLVATGGALGSVARYLVSLWAARELGVTFPFGTLIVNVLGSSLLTFLMAVSLSSEAISPRMRLTLGTGFMGGFTTYSTFNYETTSLIGDGAHGLAALNVLVTLVGCFVGGWLGMVVGKWLTTP